MSRVKMWIQRAIHREHEGALRHEAQERYGKKGFTKSGSIKKSVLTDLSHDTNKRTGRTTKTGQRARFALNVRRKGK